MDSTPLHMRHLVIPGQVVTTSGSEEGGFLRGHGTYVEGGGPVITATNEEDDDGDAVMEDESRHNNGNNDTAASRLVSSVAGTVERVNRLLTVTPFSPGPYGGQVGDLVVGRVTAVRTTSWKVTLGSSCREATLPLTGVNLPGGQQRIRTHEDALGMRRLFVEGDLVSAEVSQVGHTDGVCMLHTRSLKYGKLTNGCLVQVPPKLIVRQKKHFVTLHVGTNSNNNHDVDDDNNVTMTDDSDTAGVDLILGTNGYVWIQRTVPKSWTTNNTDETVPLAETLQKLKKRHAETPVLPEERENIARIRNAVEALKLVHCRITPETVMEVYRTASDSGVRVKDMLRPEAVLDVTKGTRRD